MPKGTIRRLITDRVYRFIRTKEGEDLFFRRSELQGVQFAILREGQEVGFEVGQARNGRTQAFKVRLARLKANSIKPSHLPKSVTTFRIVKKASPFYILTNIQERTELKSKQWFGMSKLCPS